MKNKYTAKSTPLSGGGKVSNSGKKGREHYTHAKADARQDKRSLEAAARQLKYDDLSLADKIARAKSRRGESRKEIRKLTRIFEKSKEPKK